MAKVKVIKRPEGLVPETFELNFKAGSNIKSRNKVTVEQESPEQFNKINGIKIVVDDLK